MANLLDATRLRILIGSDDTAGDQPLYQAILDAARDAGIAGVTVFRGIAGYGRSAHVHEIFHGFSGDLPIVVEIIDTEAKIAAWLPRTTGLIAGGLVTLEKTHILQRPAGEAACHPDR